MNVTKDLPLVLAPMNLMLSQPDGCYTPLEVRFLEQRARGGFEMVFTGSTAVAEDGRGALEQLGLFTTLQEKALASAIEVFARADAKTFVQLNHSGGRVPPDAFAGRRIGPSALPKQHRHFNGQQTATQSEIARVVDDFTAAARRAFRAGAHGVEIHGAHGNLGSQFLSPDFNHRSDEYGIENEGGSRFLVEVLTSIRAVTPRGARVSVRLPGESNMPSLAPHTVHALAERMEKSGADVVHVSEGEAWRPSREGQAPASRFRGVLHQGAELWITGAVKTRDDARALLDLGVDRVGVGKLALAHPELASKWRLGAEIPGAYPWTKAFLRSQGVPDDLIEYLTHYKGVIA
ncbi:MAG: hypothetical protein IOD12_11205 [Silvanigrellales bacterium]|nr:hypothetical protein [Silvanigrellales bacterium]